MEQLKMFVDGRWVGAESGKTYAAVSPADGREFAMVPCADAVDADRACRAAERAFHPWYHKSQEERSRILMKVAETFRAHAGELARTEALEHGTPITEAGENAVKVAEIFESNAWLARSLVCEQIPTEENIVSFTQLEAMGVVGIIGSKGAPTISLATRLSAALAVGNGCVVKPHESCAAIALKFAEIISAVSELPEGLVNVVTGPGKLLADTIATHPLVDMIAFTGTTETGKELMATAAKTVKRCSLELSGCNPAVIMEDADIEKAARVLAGSVFGNCGQHSSAPGCCYVHEKVYDEFARCFAEEAARVVVGDPMDEKTTMGPAADRAQKEKIEACIAGALAEGAELYYQQKPNAATEKGCFVMPTVLTNCNHNMAIAGEEVFGPVAVLAKYTDEDNLLYLTNDNKYGLCGYIWTRDISKGLFFLHNLNVGTLYVNCRMLRENQSWGTSVKESGIGKTGGLNGLLEYADKKLVCVKYQ